MPVSKKRKKDGKPVQRTSPAPGGGGEAHERLAAQPAPAKGHGKPSNPFVAQQPKGRSAQRGR